MVRNSLCVLIMAGGLGKRMESNMPKVLHPVLGKPMLVRVIENALKLHPEKIYVIVGKYKSIIEETLASFDVNKHVEYVIQEEPRGTGHAIQCAHPFLLKHPQNLVLILSGDVPLLRSSTMEMLVHTHGDACVLSSIVENPTGYGRIVMNENTGLLKIVEEKDCNELERNIKEVNSGVYCFKCSALTNYLHLLENNNAQGEYYLTDMIEIIQKNNESAVVDKLCLSVEQNVELSGVNTKEQLETLNLHILESGYQFD